MKNINKVIILSLVSSSLLLGATPNIGDVEKQIKTPDIKKEQVEIPTIKPKEYKAPMVDSGKKILISDFKITGNEHISNSELEKFFVEFKNKELTFNQLQEITSSITKFYREKGYFVARAYIPAQNILENKNVLEIAIIEGDLAEAARLQYGVIPELQKRLEQAEVAEENEEPKLIRTKVTENEIAEVVSAATGIPVTKMLQGEREKLLQMEEFLHKRVVGQDEAVVAVSNAVRRSRAGLSDPNRPSGSFLFLGPTGVGKTELTKALANFLFDSDDAMIRIDMSEFMEKHSVSRLVGAPPGYVGYEEGGVLTEAVRRKPYSVVLFDEVEKAHPDVFNILLQVLDDGRLTDSQGRVVDFKNTVIVMTSNLGSQDVRELGEGATDDEVRAVVMNAVSQHFRPEFINRIDEVVIFHPLQKDQIRAIADIQLERLRSRLKERDIGLTVDDTAFDLLIEAGFDPVYGARPLKRAIQQQVENPLAQKILSGEFQPGDNILIKAEDGHLVFEKLKLS